jgi:hypothetical protein
VGSSGEFDGPDVKCEFHVSPRRNRRDRML